MVAAAVSLALYASAAAAAGMEEILQRGKLLVAVYRDYPPFSYRRDGDLVGIDVDIAREMARRLNLPPTFLELTADETVDDDLRNAVWKGHYLDRRVADFMLHVPSEREYRLRQTEAVIFSPYYRESIVVARNPEKVFASDGLDIFQQEKVGVELDSLADIYLTYAQGGSLRANVVHYPSVDNAVGGMLAGEVAAAMGTRGEIAAALKARASTFPHGPMAAPGLTKPAWEVGLAVREAYRDMVYVLGDLIDAMRADGTMEAIFARHGIPYQPPEE